MKSKILNILLMVTSLFGYLEWSGNRHSFLFQVEGEFFLKLFSDPVSVIHPFTVLPLIGQILLIITLFQKRPGRLLTNTAIVGLGILLGLMQLIGIISFNLKIIFSTIPFIVVTLLTIRHHRIYNEKYQRTRMPNS